MPNTLNKNILATVIYYDGFNYPLTAFELWKYMIRTDYYAPENSGISFTLSDVVQQLSDKGLQEYIENKNGFYFLKGQGQSVERRIRNNKISSGKLKRLFAAAKWLKFVPFLRMICVTGAVAMKNSNVNSDLDLFLVFKYGKIWTGRTLATLLLHFLGKRRHGKKIADRACLNFFVTDESLEVITKDLFAANEYMFIFPVFGWEIFQKFQIKNRWIKSIKPAYCQSAIAPLRIIPDSFLSKTIRKAGEEVLSWSWIEKWLKKMERKKIMKNPKTSQEGSLIYANDDALIFLPNPHGPLIFEKFKEKIGELSL